MKDAWRPPLYDELVYEERIVAFIDILGWGAAVHAAGNEGARHLGWLVQLLRQIEEAAIGHRGFMQGVPRDLPFPGPSREMEVTQFSDCVVVSIPAADPNALRTLEQTLAQMCGIACQSGFLLRGGIVRGPIFHRDRLVYGPALIEAYELEQRVRYPRIVASEGMELAVVAPWRRDVDGRVFFDYLRAFGALPNQYKYLIGKGLLTANSYKVLRKYVWAQHYYDLALGPDYEGEKGAIGFQIGEDAFLLEKGKWFRPMSSKHSPLKRAPSNTDPT